MGVNLKFTAISKIPNTSQMLIILSLPTHYTYNVYLHSRWTFIKFLMVLDFENLRMGFSSFVKGNHSQTVFLDTQLHADTVTDVSKLPGHKYLQVQ
jgi:lysine/ornithine N-monooxygenase